MDASPLIRKGTSGRFLRCGFRTAWTWDLLDQTLEEG